MRQKVKFSPRAIPCSRMFQFAATTLLALSLFRACLYLLNFTRIEPALTLELFGQGLRFDLMSVCYLLAPVLLLFIPVYLFGSTSLRTGIHDRVIPVYYRIAFCILMTMEGIGAGFIQEYDHRPDALFWQYLRYPGEVVPMLAKGFFWQSLGIVGLLAGSIWLSIRLFPRPAPQLKPVAQISKEQPKLLVPTLKFASSAVIGLCILFLGIRSTLGHRPVNISTAIFSNNRIANELALNSTYTAAYALYARKNDVSNHALYGNLPNFAEAIATLRESGFLSTQNSACQNLPTFHTVQAPATEQRPRNIVLILQESLGAQFVASLGGEDLTPNLDRLSSEGAWFTNMYATGTRTVRGIEATISGFPPSASESIVKRTLSRRGFFTLGAALKPAGYTNYFIYGGEPNFDDMGSFMMGNSFDKVIAGTDAYPDAEFVGSWGVSDEDWLTRGHEIFQQADKTGPFLAVMLSTSNHTPWEIPDGKLDGDTTPGRENAVRYADYAIGEFFKRAKTADYYKNTIFVVIADHDARVYGTEFVPVQHFHIPALIISPDIQPQLVERVGSQIDLIATLLPLTGASVDSVDIGTNLLAPSKAKGRAIMQYGLNHALMVGNKVAITSPKKETLHYQYKNGGLTPTAPDAKLTKVARAYLSLADGLYSKEKYHLPSEDAPCDTGKNPALN